MHGAERACDDFRATSEAARGRYLGGGLTRRQLVGRGLGAGLAVYASQAMSLGRVFQAAEASAAADPAAPVLVSVFLPGGCDLLDTIVPLPQHGRYADLRPDLKLEDAPRLGSTGLGVHPSLASGLGGGVKGLFEVGKVGLLPGIDYANPDLSHFRSRQFWETGLITARSATGWLGRYLDVAGGRDNPLQGLSVSGTLSPVLRSSGAPVAALHTAKEMQFGMWGAWGDPLTLGMKAWDEMAARPASRPGEAAVTRAATMAKVVADELAPYTPKGGALDTSPVAYPAENRMATSLQTLAGLLSQPLGIRVAAVDADFSFDTHGSQPADLAQNLKRASEALAAFQADIEARGQADRVLTFVWSEFGRRPEQNDSHGTDHGAGGLAWVQGTRVRSGVLSDYPDLRRLDRLGNLAVTVDFRRVYSSLLEQWLGHDAASVIPNAAGLGRVGLVA